jgi:hypothetical protein
LRGVPINRGAQEHRSGHGSPAGSSSCCKDCTWRPVQMWLGSIRNAHFMGQSLPYGLLSRSLRTGRSAHSKSTCRHSRTAGFAKRQCPVAWPVRSARAPLMTAARSLEGWMIYKVTLYDEDEGMTSPPNCDLDRPARPPLRRGERRRHPVQSPAPRGADRFWDRSQIALRLSTIQLN